LSSQVANALSILDHLISTCCTSVPPAESFLLPELTQGPDTMQKSGK
jgi:hypothetical protein